MAFIAQKPLGAAWTAEVPEITIGTFISDLFSNQTENLVILVAGTAVLTLVIGVLAFGKPLAGLINKDILEQVLEEKKG